MGKSRGGPREGGRENNELLSHSCEGGGGVCCVSTEEGERGAANILTPTKTTKVTCTVGEQQRSKEWLSS